MRRRVWADLPSLAVGVAGGVLMWATVAGFFKSLFGGKGGPRAISAGTGQAASDGDGAAISQAREQGQAASATENSVAIAGTGNIVNIHQPQAASDPLAGVPWNQRPGAPRVQARPGMERNPDGDRLLAEVIIFDAVPPPGAIQARWVGEGIEQDWSDGMRQNTRAGATHLHYQWRPTPLPPAPPEKVEWEVRFNWYDGQHGARFWWPLTRHPKGHWNLDSHLGTGVTNPEYF